MNLKQLINGDMLSHLTQNMCLVGTYNVLFDLHHWC